MSLAEIPRNERGDQRHREPNAQMSN